MKRILFIFFVGIMAVSCSLGDNSFLPNTNFDLCIKEET